MIKIKGEERREKLLNKLRQAKQPLTGTSLAEEFEVSRQVIVQDIALLRARGEEIIATSQGYLMPSVTGMQTIKTTIACQHTAQEVSDELMTIVNFGAKIIDVTVEHPIYGELRGLLMIQNSRDVDRFMDKFSTGNAALLSALTDGVHLHTIEAINEQVISRLKEELKNRGYLLEEDNE